MTPPPNGPSHGGVDISEGPPAGTKRGWEVNSSRSSAGEEFQMEPYLDTDKLLLQSFSIRELLSKTHVDGVLGRSTVVLLK